MSLDPQHLDLLETAREQLRTRLMPALSGDLRYEAAMIANAMAIVHRAARAQAHGEAVETEALRRLYPESATSDLTALRRRLAQDIRNGVFDQAGARLVAEVLRPAIATRLAVSNPGYAQAG